MIRNVLTADAVKQAGILLHNTRKSIRALRLILAVFLQAALCVGAVSAAEVRSMTPGGSLPSRSSVADLPFAMEGDELAIRGTGASTGRVVPGGELWVEKDIEIREDNVRVRVRLRDEYSPVSVGLALVSPDGEWYVARTNETGPSLDRSVGQWTSVEQSGSAGDVPGGWIWLEIELGREGTQRRFSVRTWPEGDARPDRAGIVALERRSGGSATLSPAIWSDGSGDGRAAGLEVEELTTKGLTIGSEEWPIEVSGDRLVFSDPRFQGVELSLARLEQKSGVAGLELSDTTVKTASSFPCNPYRNRFVGTSPPQPGSAAAIGLPAVDHDCDGEYNEDWVDGIDNDGDGLVDEDPGSFDDWLLSWTSSDDLHGEVASGDVTAAIVTIRRVWPSYKESMIFGTIFGGPEYALAGAVRITPDPTGFAELIGPNGLVTYLLVEATSEPLIAEILESGAPLVDGQVFDRAVVFNADVNGGTPPISTSATIDGAAYTLGEPYEVDGAHTIRVEVGDSAGELVVVQRGFSVDTTPPVIGDLQPASGTVLGSTPVVITGSVSEDAVEVTVAGVAAILDPPSGGERSFTSAPVALAEGLNTVDLAATDAVGHTGAAQLILTLDTLAPAVVISTPPDGTFSTVQPIGVAGAVTEPNLAELTVNGTTVAVTAGQFTIDVALVEGTNIIEAVATDSLGRQGSASVEVVLDTTAPGVFITDPASGFVTGEVSVVVAGTYDEPLSTVTVNGLATTFGGGAFSVDAVPLADEGENFIVATATDLAGNSADSPPVLVIRDTLAPTVTMEAGGMPVLTSSPNLTVTGTATDAHLASVRVAGQAATLVGDQWTVNLTLVEGENQLIAVAEDTLGHTAETTPYTITLDTATPVVTITSPLDGSGHTSTLVPVEGSVVDPHLDVTSVNVNGTIAAVAGDTFTVELDLPEGDTILVAQAEDTLGQVGTSASVSVTVDTLPPVVTLAEPLRPLVSTPTVDVTGTVADPHLDTVTVEGIAATVTGSQFTVTGIPLTEGENGLTAIAVDSFGHSATSNEISFILDSTPPVLTVFESGVPFVDQLVLGRPAVITVEAADATLVTLVATIDGDPYVVGTPYAAGGSHYFEVTASDLAGNTATAAGSFTIDEEPPVVEILSPAPGTTHDAMTIDIYGRAGDDVVSLTVGGVSASFGVAGAGWLDWSAQGVALGQEGPNSLSLRAVDGAGNVTELDLTYRRDTLSPQIIVTTPAEDLVTRFTSLTVAGVVSDTNLERVRVNDVEVSAAPDGSFSHTVSLTEGVNTITVTAVDVVLHEASVVRTVTLDTAPPVITASAAGAPLTDGSVFGEHVVPVIEAVDDTEVNLDVTLNGAPFTSGTPVTAEGSYVLAVTATDAAGNSATLERSFSIDLTPPAISNLSIEDGAIIAEPSPLLTGVCDDAVSVTVNGQPASVTAGTFSYAGLVLSEGANTVNLVAEDDVGNQGTMAIAVTLDTTGPSLEISAPDDGALVGEPTVLVTGSATDPNLESVTVAGRDAALAGSSFQAESMLAQEGTNTITVTAADSAGNTSELLLTVERDSTEPALVVDEPGPSAILGSGTVTVSGAATDAHEVTVAINSQPVAHDAGGSFSSDLQLPAGPHTVVVEATDEVGNTATVSREITVDESAPELRITAPAAGAILSGTVVAVTGTVDEPVGIDRVTVNGREAQLDGADGFELADLALEEGANTIVARAWDTAGNSGTRSVEVVVDTVPPLVVSLVPADGSSGVPGSARPRVRFSETVDEDALSGGIRLIEDGLPLDVTLTPLGDGAEIEVAPAGGLPDDSELVLEVDVAVVDLAGHPLESTASATFSTADSASPQPPILDEVASPSCFTSLVVTGVAEAEATVHAMGDVGPASAPAAANGTFSLALDPAVGEGAVEVEVVAEDAAGNRSQPAYLAVELDCTAPRVTASDWDGATTITVRFSEVVDETTILVGQSVVVDGALSPLSFTVAPASETLTIELAVVPPVDELPMRLELTAEITDIAGNAAVPYAQLFADPSAATFIAGEVFTDSDSLKLAGARVVLEEDGGPVPGDPPTITADGRGRYELPVASSPVVIRVEADGYLPTWRRVVPIPGAATVLFDVRLSERSEPAMIAAATQLDIADARLTVDGASVPTDGFELELGPISEQGLPGLLPFGWRPLAAADICLPSDLVLDPPAVLEFTTDVPPEAIVARYDVAAHAWVAVASGGTVDVTESTTFALVAADAEPTSPGAAVPGSVLPAATAVDPGDMTATLQLDPPVILPMETSLATVTVQPTTIVPSGHPVEARLDEVLHVVDGGVLVTPPVAVDLFLYRQPDDTMVARFDLGASEAARSIALDEGLKTVNIRSLPDEVRTQDLVGPDGAGLLSPDGVGLDVPPGALDRVVGVELSGQSLDALPLSLPAGLEPVAAANLGLGDVVLSAASTMSFPGEGEPDSQYLLLSPVEVDGASSWRLIGLGALDGDRIISGPAQLDGLPAPGVTASGLYVLVRPTGDAWGLLHGVVIDIDSDPATETCVVTATGGLAQLAQSDGVYAVAAPAGTVDLFAEQLVSRNAGERVATATAGVITGDLDIVLEIVQPRVVATSPVDGAGDVSTSTPITVDFSEPLDLEPENPWGIDVLVVAGAVNEPGDGILELSAGGTRLTWTPTASFPSASRIHVTVDGNLTDLQGNPLEGGDHVFQFGVERYIGNEDVDESKIRLFVPGRDPAQPDRAVVEGDEGAVPADIWMYIEDLDHDAAVTTFQATGLGAFSTSLEMYDSDLGTGVRIGDRLRLHILDSDNPDDELYVIELKPWLTADGLGAFFNIDGGEFTTTEGIGVNAPWGAFPDNGAVRVSLLDHAAVLPQENWPSFAEARAAARLELTTEAARTLQLVIPGDPPADAGTTMHACMRIEVAGRPHPMLVRTAWWDAGLGAYVTSPANDEMPESAVEALARAASTGNPDPLLHGIRRTMDLVMLEPMIPAGLKSAGEDLKGQLLVKNGTIEGDIEVKAMFFDATAGVVYANTLYSPSEATLVAYDHGGQLKDFGDPTGGYAALDMQDTLTPGSGATVVLRPDDEFIFEVTDPDTGFVHSETGYPAPGGGGWETIPPSDAPGYGGEPQIVSADPFLLFSFDASTGRTPLSHLIEVRKEQYDSPLECTIAAGSLPNDRLVYLYNLDTGDLRQGPSSSSGDLLLSIPADVGDPMVLIVEPLISSNQQVLALRFDRTVEGLVDEGDLQLERIDGSETPQLQLDASSETLFLSPDPAWSSGAKYQLTLLSSLFVNLGADEGHDLVLPFKIADAVSGDPIFDVDVVVADAAIEGDVLLIAARDAGLSAWDISNPNQPTLLGEANSQIAAAGVASDGFGHVISLEGKVNQHVALRLWMLEDLVVPGAEADVVAVQELSAPVTNVGPGDLALEVFSNQVAFTADQASTGEPEAQGITANLNQDEDEWQQLSIPEDLLTPHHPVRLHDGVTGRVLYRGAAPEAGALVLTPGDLDLAAGEIIPLTYPLRLRAHTNTLVWAHASAGPAVLSAIEIDADGADFALLSIAQNENLLDWIRNEGQAQGACRDLSSADSVYLGRLAVDRPDGGQATLYAASRYEGVWGIRKNDTVLRPNWIDCVRSPAGSDLADIAVETMPFMVDGDWQDKTVVAVVGHRTLEFGEIGDNGKATWGAGYSIGWNATHVALDPVDRLIVVRDDSQRLAVFSIDGSADAGSWKIELVADIVLPEGSGSGPLLLDPDHGLAITGSTPVQYKPPVIELVGPDTDGDGIRERVEYLQPLGAPEAPPSSTGQTPPYIAWVTARVVGVPENQNTIMVKVEGLAPGGAAAPNRPEPFLPSSTEIELHRQTNLRLDDPARDNFVASEPILLIADERAKTDHWDSIGQAMRDELTDDNGHYALCRNCDRTDLDLDLPDGVEPVELASAHRLRVTLEIDGSSSAWLQEYATAGLTPSAEAATVPWMSSPPMDRTPGIEARAAAAPEVELVTGGLTLSRTDLALTAPGMDVAAGRHYASAGIGYGLLGWGWELAGIDRLRPNPGGTVELFTATGDRYVFGQGDSAHPVAESGALTSWTHPGELKPKTGGGWFMLTPDGGYTEYSDGGYPTLIRDRRRTDEDSGSELRFLWHTDGTLAQLTQSNGKHTTDLNPRTLTFHYEDEDLDLGNGQCPPGLITSVEDSAGRTFRYAYDAFGRLEKAGLKDVQLTAGGSTGNVVESYAHTTPSPVSAMDLERGAAIDIVGDANDQPQLTAGWSDGRVTSVTRGASGGPDPAIVASISSTGESPWTITEGTTTVAEISLAPDGDGWSHQVTIGTGTEATTTTTLIDRDGRATSTTAPDGVTTTTQYLPGARRYSFLPEIVTTTPGSHGEEASTGQLRTVYQYANGEVTQIERPGPINPVITRIERSNGGRTVLTTASDGTQTTRHLDELGRVETQTSSTGGVGTLTYDDITNGSGELERSDTTSVSGTSTTRIGRNALGQAVSSRTVQSDGAAAAPIRSSISEINVLGWTLRTASGDSATETSYDATGRIGEIRSLSTVPGSTTPVTTTVPGYTSSGMINSIVRTQGAVSESNGMSYDSAGLLHTSTTAGVETSYLYDSAGRTTKRTESWTEPGGGELTLETGYVYEPVTGRLHTTTTPGGKVTTNHYDTLGRQLGRTDHTGVREHLTLEADGRLQERRLTTGEGQDQKLWAWEELGYDGIGRQTSRTVHRFPVTPEPDPDQATALTTTTHYYEESGPKQGLVEWVQGPLGRRTTFDYDDAGREIVRNLPDGTKVETTYYPDGKIHQRTVSFDDGGETWELMTTTTYDDQGRVHQVIDPGGRTTTTLYDELGRKISVMSPDSKPMQDGEEDQITRLTTWTYGHLGRVVTETRPDSATITRSYDERGSLVSYEDHAHNTTTYSYYLNGRLKAIEYPDETERSFTYYPDGEMHTITRADGTVVTFEIDPTTGRLDTVEAPGTQPGGIVDFDYDEIGHLTSASDTDVTLGFAWDSTGNQLSETMALPGLGFGERVITRVFDNGNRPATLTMPDGLPALVRGYDDGDRLAGLTVDGQLLWNAAYNGGRLMGIDRANGLATTFAYDGEGRPTEVRTGVPDGAGAVTAPIHRLAFGWTDASLRRSKTREDTRRLVERFHYDGVGHLESNETEGIPAVAGADADLMTVAPGLDPRQVEEWWTVNQVDELTIRQRAESGAWTDYEPIHDEGGLHQVEESRNIEYNWDVNGNLEQRGSDLFSHDWRDRLVGVDQGATTTRLIVDPLGRLVAKEASTAAGDVRRIYLHDGDQVVAEYVQEAGGTAWQLDRRHHWGRWIDDLAVEQVDTDADGVLDTTLYPITDMLGSVQLLTDATGEIVERIEYQTDGTPRFYAGDATPPTATRVAWTGDGQRPTGDTVATNAFEIGFDEWIDPASVSDATATLTPDGGAAVDLTVALDDDGRGVALTGATIEAGVSFTLHLEGLTDRSGNNMWVLDRTLTVADPGVYETLEDTAPPSVLAVLDAEDGVYVLLDEPVVPIDGVAIADAITVKRDGTTVVEGVTERLGAKLLKWTADGGGPWYLQQDYEITEILVEDLGTAPSAVGALPGGFTHLAQHDGQALVAYSKADHSSPLARSRFGVTSLFQGRGWHEELGVYYYRARWYSPEGSSFLERDPVAHESQTAYQWLNSTPANAVDPAGYYAIDFHFFAIYFLSRSAGLPLNEALQVSWASQYVDDADISSPADFSKEKLWGFHFISPRMTFVQRANSLATENLARAEGNRDLISLGIALHSWADTWAHEGFTGWVNLRGGIGHGVDFSDAFPLEKNILSTLDEPGLPYNKWPDHPFRAVDKAMEAAETSYHVLRGEALRRSRPVNYLWKTIEAGVRQTFKTSGRASIREQAWRNLIGLYFPGEYNIAYFEENAPRSWIRRFNSFAQEQQQFVMEMRNNPTQQGPSGRVFDVVAPSPPIDWSVPPGLGRGYQ